MQSYVRLNESKADAGEQGDKAYTVLPKFASRTKANTYFFNYVTN